MCLQHSWDVCVWKKYYPSSASGAPLHICPMAKWLIISGIQIQDTPRRQRTNKGLCLLQVSPPPTLPTLVFHSPSYRERAPLLNPTGHLENDHLRDFSHKRLHKQQSIVCPSVEGWEFTLKALDVPPGSVSTESYWMTRGGWGMPFFLPPLKCSVHSDLAYCGAHKWPSEEKERIKKGWGQGSDERLPSGLLFCYQILQRHKKSNSLIAKVVSRRRKEVTGELFLCACHLFSSLVKSSFCSSSAVRRCRCCCLVSEAEPAFLY